MNILTPIAALAVAAESVLISALCLRHGDASPMKYSMAMAVMAAFLSHGRFAFMPL